MYLGFVLISLFTVVLPAQQASSNGQISYNVSEVSGISWPDYFVCKLSNYDPSKSVRFRVYWNDFEFDSTDTVSQEYLTSLLLSSEQIELYDVRFRNYFRLSAKVRIAGRSVADLLAEQKITPTIRSESQSSGASKKNNHQYSRQIATYWSQTSNASIPTKPVSVKRRTVKVQDLLDTVVDCSVITDETSLSEALQVLSSSVDPPLPLVVFWNDLQTKALIGKDTPIGVSGLGRMKVGQALKIILRSVSTQGPKLGIAADGGVLTLATQQTLTKDKETRVYSIEDLLGIRSVINDFFGPGS